LFGGRFNSEGKSVVYTSGSLSLALLEMLVRTNDKDYLSSCLFFHADIPLSLVQEVASDQLPDDWDALPYGTNSQKFGDEWIDSRRSAVLKVPSVVIPVEWNYVINSLHVDFKHIEISRPDELVFDERMMVSK